MSNKIFNKFKEPKSTEFSKKDLVVDVKNGHLYYKSDKGVHKLIGDNLITPIIESGRVWTDFGTYISYTPSSETSPIIKIGTSTPGEALEVTGNISASGDIYATGNIGIGTASPTERLHIVGRVDSDDVALKIQNTFDDNNPANGSNAALLLAAASSNAYFRVHSAPDDEASDHKIDIGSTAGNSFLTFTPSSTERMRITSDGKVGIGTETPTTELDVPGTGSFGYLIIDYDALPTSDPNVKGQVYRNGSNQLFVSTGS